MNASTLTPSTNPPVIPPSTASHALHSLVASVLLEAGFDGADPQVVLELERMTFEMITTVHSLSTSYAAHSNRLHPSAYDLLEACLDQGFEVEDLYKSATNKFQKSSDPLPILPPPSPPPAFLPSDDEADPPIASTSTKRKKLLANSNSKLPLPEYAHPHAPPLPPGHSWKNTTKAPLPPLPPTPSFAEMDAKLLQTRLVEDELGRLIEGTQVALPKQVLKSSRTKKRDRKGKGKEVVAALPLEGGGDLSEGGVAAGAGGGGGDMSGSAMEGLVMGGGGEGGSVDAGVGVGGGSNGIEVAAAPSPILAPPPPPAFFAPMEDVPELPMGPTAAALVAQADAEGLGVVNYRRRRGRG